MGRKHIGIEFDKPEGAKITKVKLDEKAYKALVPEEKNDYIHFLTKFIGGKKNYKIARNAFTEAMEKSLPEDIEKKCRYCKGLTKDTGEKRCAFYYYQMETTFFLAGQEFVQLIIDNYHIFKGSAYLQKLTVKFFDSFVFIKGRGVTYFDLDKITRETLNAGFLSISMIFSNSEVLQNLKGINNTLDDLNQKSLENKTLQNEDEEYLELQKEFFEKKRQFFKEKLFIDKEEALKTSNVKPKTGKTPKDKEKVSIPKTVLYYYYLQTASYFPYFENHPDGKVGAIKSLLIEDKIDTTPKYFQMKYNEIANHTTNRISKKQESNISYVANNMLEDYPKAKKIALSEHKLALSKNR